MTDLFANCPDRRSTESVKWGIYDADVLPMWVADMDFLSPQPVRDALAKRVEHGVYGYPLVPQEFKQVIVDRMQQRYQWKITSEDLMFIPGVVPGFNLVCQAFTRPGESILMQTPVYPPFLCAPDNAQARGIHVDLVRQPDGTYSIDFDAFERAIEADTRVFIMSNPHNPVGRVFRKDELEKLAEICLRHQVIVCADEIHSDLVYSGHVHIPIASLSKEISRNTVTLIAPSKTFNIAGLECSVIICTDPGKREILEKARRGLLGHVNVMGLTAGLAAYRESQAWLDELLITLEGNRDFLVEFIQKRMPGIKLGKPEGTYLAWLDCRGLNLPQDPYHFFLEKARVAMNDGAEFGKAGEGFLRLNFGCPRAMLEEALHRMENALQSV